MRTHIVHHQSAIAHISLAMKRRCLWASMLSLWFLWSFSQNFSLCQEMTRKPPKTPSHYGLQLPWPLTQPHTDHWNVSSGSFTRCKLLLQWHQQRTCTHTHTCPHTHMHTLLYFPCCFQNVSSAWAVLIVLIVMNFLYIWRWILYYCYYYYYCGHSFSAHFWVGVDSTLLFSSFISHWQHLKKNVMIIMIIVVVIRMIIPGLMSVSQFVCNNVARTSQYLNHWKRRALILHTSGWIFHSWNVTCFPFLQTPYDMFGSMNVQRCASPPSPPPPALFPSPARPLCLLLSFCVAYQCAVLNLSVNKACCFWVWR